MPKTDLDQRSINALRVLAMDGVEKANSGHPGMPMGMADVAYVLWTRHLKHNPKDPLWPNRDRFILSAGHGSMLLYSLLYLTGYPLALGDLQQFRQWGSKTAGHPEYDAALGIERCPQHWRGRLLTWRQPTSPFPGRRRIGVGNTERPTGRRSLGLPEPIGR